MFAVHVFVIVSFLLLFGCNKEVEAPSSSTSGAAAKVQRSQTMRASSRSESPKSRTSSSSSLSSSRGTHELKDVDLQPLIDTVRSEATAQTYSGGRIDPSVHGVQARIRSIILRHTSRVAAGAAVGVGFVARGKIMLNNWPDNVNETSTSVTKTNTSITTTPTTSTTTPMTTTPNEVENPI